MLKYKNFIIINKLNEMKQSEDVDKQALSTIRKSFTQIITNWGFFSNLLFNLNIYEVPDDFCNTMCTDGKSIGYSANFVKKLTISQVNFVIIHELMHNANLHFNRMGSKDPKIWNYAGDYAINILINDMVTSFPALLKTPNSILLDEKYRNMSTEQIYDDIVKNIKGNQKGDGKGNQKGDGKGNQKGDGKGNQKGDGLTPDDIKKPGTIEKVGKEVYNNGRKDNDNNNVEDLAKKWKEILQTAKNKGIGSESMDRWLNNLSKPKVNWRNELKRFIRDIFVNFDYGYFNKKFISRGDYWATVKLEDKEGLSNAVIAIDTSGSIGQETLNKFASELYKLFKTYEISKCYVIWCDYEISSVQVFDKIDSSFKLNKLKPKGGGGTSFIPPFKWVDENLIKKGKTPAFLLYFTDAYGDAPEISKYKINKYMKRILWVITENDDASNIKFGKKIFIDKINP